jgi:hypothetical protein
MNEYMPFFAMFLNYFLPPVLVALAGVLSALAVQGIKYVSNKVKEMQPELFAELEWIVPLAVKAAEQAGAANLIADKKEYAIDAVEAYLAEYGFEDVDFRVIEAAIEAEVLEQFNSGWVEVEEDIPDDDEIVD